MTEGWERTGGGEETGAGRSRLGALLQLDRSSERVLLHVVGWGGGVILLVGLLVLSGVNVVRVLVDGLQNGAVFSLIALGIALVYKATRILNFAQGEFGTVAAFLALTIFLRGDLVDELTGRPPLLEMIGVSLLVIAVAAVIGVAVNVVIVEKLARADELIALVATVGVMLVLVAAQAVTFEVRARRFPRYLDGAPCFGPETGSGAAVGLCPLTLGGLPISWHTVIVAAVLGVTAAALGLFFRTRTGVALLATAQEPFAAQLQGVSPRAMATLAWGTAGALGGIGGLLGAGIFNQVTPGMMTTTFLIPAFVAAVLGGLTSMVGAVVGGLVLGLTVAVTMSLLLAYELTGVVPGAPQTATLVVLLLVLLLRPRGLLGKEA